MCRASRLILVEYACEVESIGFDLFNSAEGQWYKHWLSQVSYIRLYSAEITNELIPLRESYQPNWNQTVGPMEHGTQSKAVVNFNEGGHSRVQTDSRKQ